jgi:hypothetical protein
VIAEVVFSEDCFSEDGNIGVNHLALLLLREHTAGSIPFLGLSFRFIAIYAIILHGFFLIILVQRLDFCIVSFWRVF